MMEIPRTLVLTGHFPPEPGGVQTFTWELVRRLPADRVVVVAPADVDATLASLQASGESAAVIGAVARGTRGVLIEE